MSEPVFELPINRTASRLNSDVNFFRLVIEHLLKVICPFSKVSVKPGLTQSAPKFLVLLDQMPHHIGLELHPVRHLGNCDTLFHFRPSDFDPTDKLFICRTAERFNAAPKLLPLSYRTRLLNF